MVYYDDVADLTWLTNANAGAGSIYDDIGANNGTMTDGGMSWQNAMDWVANLEVAGVTGWRLPDTLQPDASCSHQTSAHSSGYNCSGSEMGNLFYSVLGGSAGSSIATTHNANYLLFNHVQAGNSGIHGQYWSATLTPYMESWAFNMEGGAQTGNTNTFGFYAWAVHDGDVASVPEPATISLLGLGLLGLVLRRRHTITNTLQAKDKKPD